MTDDVKAATKQRKKYVVMIAFYMPNAGPISVMAESEEHAKELVPKMVAHLKDVNIIDVYEDNGQVQDTEPEAGNPAQMMN